MREAHSSAPGKVILAGEHSVVYGKHAVAAAVSLRTRCTVVLGAQPPVVRRPGAAAWSPSAAALDAAAQAVAAAEAWPVERLCAAVAAPEADQVAVVVLAVAAAREAQADPAGAIVPSVAVTSEVPMGAGLGSSAAFSVALSAALLAAHGVDASADRVDRLAHMGECIFHGKPSGLDAAVIAQGGAVLFTTGGLRKPVSVPPLALLVVNTHVPRSTRELVAEVRRRRDADPEAVDARLEAMDATALGVCRALETGETAGLAELVRSNQQHLNALGVGHPALDQVCAAAERHGMAAKLTGAGGGGCALVFAGARDEAGFAAEMEAAGFSVHRAVLESRGVVVQGDQ